MNKDPIRTQNAKKGLIKDQVLKIRTLLETVQAQLLWGHMREGSKYCQRHNGPKKLHLHWGGRFSWQKEAIWNRKRGFWSFLFVWSDNSFLSRRIVILIPTIFLIGRMWISHWQPWFCSLSFNDLSFVFNRGYEEWGGPREVSCLKVLFWLSNKLIYINLFASLFPIKLIAAYTYTSQPTADRQITNRLTGNITVLATGRILIKKLVVFRFLGSRSIFKANSVAGHWSCLVGFSNSFSGEESSLEPVPCNPWLGTCTISDPPGSARKLAPRVVYYFEGFTFNWDSHLIIFLIILTVEADVILKVGIALEFSSTGRTWGC